MLISYSHKFIFIHTYKVAGRSIRVALQEYDYNPRRALTSRFLRKLGVETNYLLPYYKRKPYFLHATAREIKRDLPKKVYSNFYKFAFVRNPWDWQVSLYHYMLRKTDHHQHTLIKSMQNFDEYIEWRVNEDKRFQKDFVTDEDGKLIVDFVGKFERLAEDFRHICRVLHINNASLPHLNQTPHRNYMSYYNERTRKLIENHFREDIEFFDYTFDNT